MTTRSFRPLLPALATTLAVGLLLGHDALRPQPPSPTTDGMAAAGPVPTGVLARQLGAFVTPPPTEHWLAPDAEEKGKAARKAWVEKMHRAAPDVDWKAIERDNGLRMVERRRLLKDAPPAAHGSWVERGSDNQAGRMHVARHGPDGMLYAGSSRGGAWRGTLDGADWEPLADDLFGGVHWLEVVSGEAESDPPVVIAATDGGLVHRTTDAGASWEPVTGLASPWSVRRLLMASDGSEALFMVAVGDTGSFLYRSVDRGATWSAVFDLGGSNGDAWAPRDGGDGLYVMAGGVLSRSDDRGDSWTEVGSLPVSPSRVELAGSEAGAPRFWAVADAGRLYRSDDAGVSWTEIRRISDYWGTVVASVTDVDLFAWGGVEVWYTTDGRGFERVNYWYDYYSSPADTLHADVPGMDVIPDGTGGETWYINTDGGLYRSRDGLQTVENLSLDGLRVSQYYDTHTSTANPEHVLAGAQDQGYQASATIAQDADDAFELDQLISGDYGHLSSSDGTHGYVYSTYPGFILIQEGEESPALYTASFPTGESYVPWIPPVVADPDQPTAFFFPASRLYRYTRVGATWLPEQYSEHDFALASGEYMTSLAFSPLDSDRVYAATSHGRAWASHDKGLTWTESVNRVVDDNWYYGHAVVASNTDPDLVYYGGSGYGVPAVYRSVDGGFTFQPWGEGLPDTLVYSLCEAADGSGVMVAGTESSAYRRDPGDEAWWEITDAGAPITTYWSCEALAHDNVFRFGTYGRGMWDYHFIYSPEPEDTGDPGDSGEPGDSGTPGDTGPTGDGGSDGGADGGSTDGGAPTDGGSTDGGAVGDGGTADDPPAGCGCAAATGAGSAGLLLLLLPGIVLRRRS